MADKSISELTEALSVQNADLFVLEQASQAKKLTGATLISELADALNGHGGINSVTLQSTSGLNKTYRMTFADGSYTDYVVSDGNSISSVTFVSQTGLVKNFRINYSNGTSSTFSLMDGNGISDIEFGYKSGRENHYIVTMADGTEYEIVVNDGETGEQGIQGIQGDTGNGITGVNIIGGSVAVPGSYVTYRMYFSNGEHYDFSIWNGADGGGAGDMVKAMYDPQNIGEDIYQYVQDYVSEHAGTGDVSSVNGIEPVDGDVTLSAADVGAVPTTRTVNGKALSSNININPGDVGAVPVSRTVNGKALSANITLNPGDIGAATPADIVAAIKDIKAEYVSIATGGGTYTFSADSAFVIAFTTLGNWALLGFRNNTALTLMSGNTFGSNVDISASGYTYTIKNVSVGAVLRTYIFKQNN